MTAEQFSTEYENGFLYVARFLAGKGIRDTEELSQQAWVKAWAHRNAYRGDTAFRNWVCTIAFNCFRESIRRDKYICFVNSLTEGHYFDSTEATVDAERLLSKLSSRDAALLRLFYMDGMRLKEIGAALEVPESTIKTRLYRAKATANSYA